ncbi:MAG TPA: beta-L-arabinofuranosidase domain-containing protein [Terriglobales bacterium]
MSLVISRRSFLQSASLSVAGAATCGFSLPSWSAPSLLSRPLEEFTYRDVDITSELHERQLRNTHEVLMELSEDSLLKPIRRMGGLPAPGAELGGWYLYDPNYDWHTFDAGFAPGATFGQWVSALARMYAINGSQETREKVLRLNRLYAKSVTGEFFESNRFPTYCYDKIVLGLIDAHRWCEDPEAFSILEKTTDTALPHMPKKAIRHGTPWREGKDESYTWDESYTIAENLFLAYQRGAGERYKALGKQYLADEYYDPLSEGQCNFAGRHAYSHVNSLSSAMQAYLTLGSEKHLRAARNAFDMLAAQSYATGGWGPDEQLRAPGSDDVFNSLSNTHNTFETPCGAYAHFKLTRYLMRVSGEPRYGDSMERMMYNTILGAKPLRADGRTFYYSDFNFQGKKVYCDHRWPCCSGTMPQVATDYRINTYLHDAQGVYVNLYIPSTLRCVKGGTQVTLTQKGTYPLDPVIHFEVTLAKPAEFVVNFRIPAWAECASLSVNGARGTVAVTPGGFVAVRREWKTGDRVELNLPLKIRLEAIDPKHSQTVALLSGPLVLFAINKAAPAITRKQLLGARKTGAQTWQVETAAGPITMLPFFAIDDEQYSTYLNVT